MKNKINQHYVWQKYLKPWMNDGKIHCLRNNEEVFLSNPRNVASERHFYKINELTSKDFELIREIFINNYSGLTKETLENWLDPIEKIVINRDRVMQTGSKTLNEKFDILLKNAIEELHMIVENNGINGLNKAQSGDISFLSEVQEIGIDFILFLTFQYTRTKKMKESVRQGLGENVSIFTNFDDAYNIIAPLISMAFASTLYNKIKNKELFCNIIYSNSGNAFITGDQPVINIHANFLGETSELALYYPLSPKSAILISGKEKSLITVEKIKEYNDLIEKQSLSLVFASDKSCLDKYIK